MVTNENLQGILQAFSPFSPCRFNEQECKATMQKCSNAKNGRGSAGINNLTQQLGRLDATELGEGDFLRFLSLSLSPSVILFPLLFDLSIFFSFFDKASSLGGFHFHPFRRQPKNRPDRRSVGADVALKAPDWRGLRRRIAGNDPISPFFKRGGCLRVTRGSSLTWNRSRTGT